MTRVMPEIEKMTRGKNSSFQKVASYILSCQDEVIFMTLDKLAGNIGVSTTTVLRFARALGFEGYRDFQMQMRNEVVNEVSIYSAYSRLNEKGETRDSTALLQETMELLLKSIRKTFEQMNPGMLKQALTLFRKAAGNVYLCGLGSSFALAYLAYTRMVPLRKNVRLFYPDIAETMDPVLSMDEDDVCFFFIFHRYHKRSLQLLKEIFSRGVRIVLITDYPVDEIKTYGQVILPCFVESTSPKNSLAGAVGIIDYLCAALSLENKKEALNRFASVNKLYEENDIAR